MTALPFLEVRGAEQQRDLLRFRRGFRDGEARVLGDIPGENLFGNLRLGDDDAVG
jgi:hypothetical protein